MWSLCFAFFFFAFWFPFRLENHCWLDNSVELLLQLFSWPLIPGLWILLDLGGGMEDIWFDCHYFDFYYSRKIAQKQSFFSLITTFFSWFSIQVVTHQYHDYGHGSFSCSNGLDNEHWARWKNDHSCQSASSSSRLRQVVAVAAG